MPPKKKTAKRQTKSKAGKHGGASAKTAGKSNRVLRKNPKKKTKGEEARVEKLKTKPKGKPKQKAKPAKADSLSNDEIVDLNPRESEDNFTDESDKDQSNENSSSNAVADSSGESPRGSSESGEVDMAGEINKHVDAALSNYFKKRAAKKRRHKRRRRDSSSSPSSDSSESSESTSDGSGDESDESEGSKERSRKRKRKDRKRKGKGRKKGENLGEANEFNSASVSTVYTRGCKSPQNAIIEGSSDEGLDGGNIPSDANTEEFIDSLNTSNDYVRSTPDVGRRREGSRSPARGRDERREGRQQHNESERERNAERYRDQADTIIRDLHQNKSDLAKPSGEMTQFIMSSLVRDFKHFHLTSHVDKKLKERIKDQDFTVDFRRLLPRSRARTRQDGRMQVMHKDGETYFVPAADREVKEITDYKV